MEQLERAIRLRKDEIVEVKNLFETVMTFASHGMFYRSGRIMADNVVKAAGTDLGRIKDALIREGWATDVDFDGDVVTVAGSIEVTSSDAPTCHVLRGIMAKVFEERTGKDVYCHERKCVSKGDDRCVFVIDTEVL
jgi:predicted hydrocarbon binding protein